MNNRELDQQIAYLEATTDDAGSLSHMWRKALLEAYKEIRALRQDRDTLEKKLKPTCNCFACLEQR